MEPLSEDAGVVADEPCQAVIFIHGIGQHLPLDPLRSLVDGLGFPTVYSRHDPKSETLELRRLVAPATRTAPRTLFYEVNWSHQYAPGGAVETLFWALRYLFASPKRMAVPAMRRNVLVVRAVALVVIAAGLLLAAAWALGFVSPGRLGLIGIVLGLLLAVAGPMQFFSTSLASAARYLTPRPRDIPARNAVRRQGMELIRRLHKDPSVRRIVVVGHSLGSTIAYDVVRGAWHEFRRLSAPVEHRQPAANAYVDGFRALVAAQADGRHDARAQYAQELQLALHAELHELGMAWKVTDLVTMGSPLAHANLLLSRDQWTLADAIAAGERPTCPPISPTSHVHDLLYHEPVGLPDGRRWSLKAPGSAGTFTCTRWTNVYVPSGFLLTGDLIGGPVAPTFGAGVRDRTVLGSRDAGRNWGNAPMWQAHSTYWSDPAARGIIRDALGLDALLSPVLRPMFARGQQAPEP